MLIELGITLTESILILSALFLKYFCRRFEIGFWLVGNCAAAAKESSRKIFNSDIETASFRGEYFTQNRKIQLFIAVKLSYCVN